MSNLTNSKTPNPKNPSSLKPRYEIRKLELEHIDWANAIVSHSNAFYSTIFPVCMPEDMSSRCHRMLDAMDYLVRHQVSSNLSFGVFDTQYEYKTEEARNLGGKLFWDPSESRIKNIEKEQGMEAAAQKMLQQMDFPLVSVALSYDLDKPLDPAGFKDLVSDACLPQFPIIYQVLGASDKREPESWKSTGPGQVMMRNATSTRRDYEGQGIMAALARWLMREAAQRGYRGIQIEAISDAVIHVWKTAEPPFQGIVVSEFQTEEYKNEDGKNPFAPAKQQAAKVWVDLKAQP